MKKILSICLIISIISSVLFYSSWDFYKSYGVTEMEELSFQEVISYDIWKHTNGKWQSTGYPGGKFSFKYTSNLNIDATKKLNNVRVQFLNVPSNNDWYDMSVKTATISAVAYDSKSVSYSVSGNLTSNIAPIDIKQYSWQNASVEGYRYYIPIKITIIYEKLVFQEEIADSENDDENLEDGGSEDNEGQDIPAGPIESDDPPESDEPEEPEEKIDFNVKADLLLPNEAYMGHPVLMQDCSTFSDGKTRYTAYKFYKEGLGSNYFEAVEGPGEMDSYKVSRSSSGYYTDQYGIFSEAGRYKVKLTAKVNDNYAAEDSEYIKILPVPNVNVSVGGIQKENRKQILNVNTALDPAYPLKRMWIEISEKNGANRVHLDFNPENNNNSNDNSQLIKTRVIKDKESDKYFSRQFLEFLTKNKNETVLYYKVYVEDVLGRSNEATGNFIVYPDEAPKAIIDMPKYHVREPESNISKIRLNDISLTYNDRVERKWKWKSADGWTDDFPYEDNSLGSNKNIIHKKSGVGESEYMLILKDVIPENETLTEYITEDDRKTGTAYAKTDVVNVAPTVFLEAREKKKAEILVLTDESNVSNGKNVVDELKIKMAESGIDSDVYFQKIEGNFGEKNELGSIITVETPFSFKAQWTSFESQNFISDSRKLYKIGADFGQTGGGTYKSEPEPKSPYIIQAIDLESGNTVWEKQIDMSVMDLGNDFHLSQDDSEKYLYLSNDEKTLIVEKDDGSIISVVNEALSGSNFVNENSIFSFNKKGVVKVNRKDGSISYVDNTPVYGNSIMLKNKINYIVNKDGKLQRRYFDMDSETYEFIELGGNVSEYVGYDIDIYGNVAAVCMWSKNGPIVKSLCFWDSENNFVKEIFSELYDQGYTVVKDEMEKFSYAGFIYHSDKTVNGVHRYYNKVKTVGIFNDNTMCCAIDLKKGYPTKNEFVYSYSRGNNVFLISGSEYWYELEDGTSGYTEKAQCFHFDFDNNKVIVSPGSGSELNLNYNYSEYGSISDQSLVMQITKGNPKYNGISGSVNMFTKYYKNADWFLKKYSSKYFSDESDENRYVFILGNINTVSEFEKLSNNNIEVFSSSSNKQINNEIEKIVLSVTKKQKTNSIQRNIFKKGQNVIFNGQYSDYENDPSKSSYYVYYHYPYNDGECEDANYIVDENFNIVKTINPKIYTLPLNKFYKDGMYKVQHWQFDNTGNVAYDKMSNVAEMVFYIQGSSSQNVPWIKNIKTLPEIAKNGKSLNVTISFDDTDKDELILTTKVYKNDILIKESVEKNLCPDIDGNYIPVIIPISEHAESGAYKVISKISDENSFSVKEYSFIIVSDYGISGMVNHTEQWNNNRKKYNVSLFKNENNVLSNFNSYKLQPKPRNRGINVFWSEEKFMLNAYVTGNPEKVIVKLSGTNYESVLADTGEKNSDGKSIYSGYLWDGGLKGKWGINTPSEAVFIFSSFYAGGENVKSEYRIIIDDSDSYWRIHKKY